ncbi:MAG: type II toxin-antitoxin system RelE/ParE family toxin [bacterium]|nr:type II toxin-antitoxin system RelE/ParE family toxin [bacterium]
MIQKIKHKGLKKLYKTGASSDVHAEKLTSILGFLDVAAKAKDMDLPGYKLHPLKGNFNGFWSVWVNGNWRVIWRFDEDDDATDVDYIDYHGK